MKLDVREQIKLLLFRRKTTITELAQYLTQETGKKYTFGSLCGKLNRHTLSYEEFVKICEILDYGIEIKDLRE